MLILVAGAVAIFKVLAVVNHVMGKSCPTFALETSFGCREGLNFFPLVTVWQCYFHGVTLTQVRNLSN